MADRRHRPSLSDSTSPISPLAAARRQSARSPPEGLVPSTYQYQDYMSAPSPDELAFATLQGTQDEEPMQSPPMPTAASHTRTPQVGFSNSSSGTSGSAGAQFTTQSGYAGSPDISSTAYDPVGAYVQGSNELPNRYGRQSQASLGGLEPPRSSTERLTKNMATASIRSSQSKRSKYDSMFS
jgi:hypothetical protein